MNKEYPNDNEIKTSIQNSATFKRSSSKQYKQRKKNQQYIPPISKNSIKKLQSIKSREQQRSKKQPQYFKPSDAGLLITIQWPGISHEVQGHCVIFNCPR